METTTRLICCPAQSMGEIPDATVDLVVTSPPYPMVAMWDEIFTRQDERIGGHLSGGHGAGAFELMHGILDGAWAECAAWRIAFGTTRCTAPCTTILPFLITPLSA